MSFFQKIKCLLFVVCCFLYSGYGHAQISLPNSLEEEIKGCNSTYANPPTSYDQKDLLVYQMKLSRCAIVNDIAINKNRKKEHDSVIHQIELLTADQWSYQRVTAREFNLSNKFFGISAPVTICAITPNRPITLEDRSNPQGIKRSRLIEPNQCLVSNVTGRLFVKLAQESPPWEFRWKLN